jgi:hypothetical protein
MVKGRERKFITGPQTLHWKRQRKHSAHLQPSLVHSYEFSFKQQRIRGRGQRCAQLNSPSHRYVLVEHYLSLRVLEKVSSEVIAIITCGEQSGSHEMITPVLGYSLIIIGNCSHLGGAGLSCKAPLFFRGSSVLCHKLVIHHSYPFLILR